MAVARRKLAFGSPSALLFSLIGFFPAYGQSDRAPAPPSAQHVLANYDDVERLFENECIWQKDGDWVREEAARKYRSCWWRSAGREGDCEQDVVTHIEWTVPTANHMTASLTVGATNTPPDLRSAQGPQYCEIGLPGYFDERLVSHIDHLIALNGPKQIATHLQLNVWSWPVEVHRRQHYLVELEHIRLGNGSAAWQLRYTPGFH